MIGFVAIALSAAAAQAAVPPSEPTIAVAPGEKRLCRREIPTGSVLPGKPICLTAAQWKRVNDTRESMMDGYYHRSTRAVPQTAQ